MPGVATMPLGITRTIIANITRINTEIWIPYEIKNVSGETNLTGIGIARGNGPVVVTGPMSHRKIPSIPMIYDGRMKTFGKILFVSWVEAQRECTSR